MFQQIAKRSALNRLSLAIMPVQKDALAQFTSVEHHSMCAPFGAAKKQKAKQGRRHGANISSRSRSSVFLLTMRWVWPPQAVPGSVLSFSTARTGLPATRASSCRQPLAPMAKAPALMRERVLTELLAIDVLEARAALPALALMRQSAHVLEQQSDDKALLVSGQAIVRGEDEGQAERGSEASPGQP
jgi:hypothetical protein